MKDKPKWENAEINLDEYKKPLVLSLKVLKKMRDDLMKRKAEIERLRKKQKGK